MLYGKLPARGDFVRAGLPRDFTDPWDDWLQSVIAGSRALMGEAWLPAFLEAPVWRFALPAGMCGAQAVLGLMLPSVDRAGRYFPLTFAALSPADLPSASGRGLARPLRGRRTRRAGTGYAAGGDRRACWARPTCRTTATGLADAVWWSDGSPRVKPVAHVLHRLPDAATYAAMLGAAHTELDRRIAAGRDEMEVAVMTARAFVPGP